MMILIAALLIALLFARVEKILYDTFSNPYWLQMEEPEIYIDNSEYDWGHNIKNYMEEEL